MYYINKNNQNKHIRLVANILIFQADSCLDPRPAGGGKLLSSGVGKLGSGGNKLLVPTKLLYSSPPVRSPPASPDGQTCSSTTQLPGTQVQVARLMGI